METAAFGIREREIEKAVTLPVLVLKTPTFWNQLGIRSFEKPVDEIRARDRTAFGIKEREREEFKGGNWKWN